MFFDILTRDIKRKKTMNIILLIFVLLSAMFAAASTNNMISVYGGIDYFLEKANIPDYVAITLNEGTDNSSDKIIENAKLNYFNKNDEVITEIPEGHIYLGGILATSKDVHIGDKITLDYDDIALELTIDGFLKDALFGSPFMGNPRMLMNDRDVNKLRSNEKVKNASLGGIYYIRTDDFEGLKDDLSGITNSLFMGERDLLKKTFMLQMLIAGLLLIVSICLIIIAFTMLSFTIRFTLGEDFREIGVMKAVVIKSGSIRIMYLTKYLFISIIGATIGYFASIPFGKALMSIVSEQMVIGNNHSYAIGILSAIMVVVFILGFCYHCTSSVKPHTTEVACFL